MISTCQSTSHKWTCELMISRIWGQKCSILVQIVLADWVFDQMRWFVRVHAHSTFLSRFTISNMLCVSDFTINSPSTHQANYL